MTHPASFFRNRFTEGLGPWSDAWVRSGWRLQVHCTGGQARVLDPARRIVKAGTRADCLDLITRCAPSDGRRRGVVLLHGILNHPGIMDRLEAGLAASGWAVANLAYPSTRLPIATHAAFASDAARALADDGAGEISFVGHSLGGLIARLAMARAVKDGWRPGRLVLVGSPVAGSAMARSLRRLPGYETLLGQCGVSLAAACAAPAMVARETIVIAGGNGGRGFNPLLHGDNDFTVTVAETLVPGAAHLLVRAVHNALPRHPDVVRAAIGFLENRGRLPDGWFPQ